MRILFLSIAFILAGSSVVSAQFVSDYLSHYAITFLSLVIASAALLCICGKRMYQTAKWLSKRTWMIIIMQAVFDIRGGGQ